MSASDRPLILVSNDDGYQAPGIRALAEALDDLGDVWVVAPEKERSAISHAISLHKPLRIGQTGPRSFWCSGTPTDSVYVAFHHLLGRMPDLVVSGVNRGANLGDDVTYSGTVAAAMEACLLGVRALAVSLASTTDRDFGPAARLARTIAEELLGRPLPNGTLLNLNVPGQYDPARGVRVTRLGRRNYGRVVSRQVDPRGKPYYWIGGPDLGFEPLEGSDCDAVHEGVAALTPVQLDLTNHGLLRELAGWRSVAPREPT